MNKLITLAVLLTASTSSFAADGTAAGSGVDQVFSSVDLTTVAAFIIGTGTVIIGITLAEKGVIISKRNIKKA